MQILVTDLSIASKLVAPHIALQMLIRESTTHQAFGALLFGVGVQKIGPLQLTLNQLGRATKTLTPQKFIVTNFLSLKR